MTRTIIWKGSAAQALKEGLDILHGLIEGMEDWAHFLEDGEPWQVPTPEEFPPLKDLDSLLESMPIKVTLENSRRKTRETEKEKACLLIEEAFVALYDFKQKVGEQVTEISRLLDGIEYVVFPENWP